MVSNDVARIYRIVLAGIKFPDVVLFLVALSL
jgi:hypothetical protein